MAANAITTDWNHIALHGAKLLAAHEAKLRRSRGLDETPVRSATLLRELRQAVSEAGESRGVSLDYNRMGLSELTLVGTALAHSASVEQRRGAAVIHLGGAR